MKIGFIGLGRMGSGMVKRLLADTHEVVVFNRSPEKTKELAKSGAVAAFSLEELIQKLPTPRIVWVMVPAGEATEKTVQDLGGLLKPGDIVIDGGNSFYKDSIRRSLELSKKGIHFSDAGTSGGIWGLEKGYCIMAGAEAEVFKKIEPLLKSLTAPEGYLHAGPVGSGHFTKMVHNGIEYGMLQAYAEGFELLKASGFNLDSKKISHLWNQGSVVKSWLLELLERVFAKDPRLEGVEGFVEDSGEGRWTVETAIEKNVATPVITASLFERFHSRDKEKFSARVIAALRNEFGGHSIQKKG